MDTEKPRKDYHHPGNSTGCENIAAGIKHTTKKPKGKLRIGTSNIIIPGNKQSFPEAFRNKTRLSYYASLFNTLEVNSSFYKLHKPATFEKWASEVNDNFQFTIKLWKEITHAKDLDWNEIDLEVFLQAAEKIGNKKGCLLLQFPGKITVDYFNEVERILAVINQLKSDYDWRLALEFRNSTWYIGEVNELLDEYKASLVIHDLPKGKNIAANQNAQFVYKRFHGPAGNYRGSYTNSFLEAEWEKINQQLTMGIDVYVYFNNTIGSAYENAMTLQQIHNGHLGVKSQ